ncbi:MULTISPECIES: hypothetical protein [unclassified Okeania]|nr:MULTISPECIES: hypothetical protein [unclassified Okeania]
MRNYGLEYIYYLDSATILSIFGHHHFKALSAMVSLEGMYEYL